MAANTGATFLRIMLGSELSRLRQQQGITVAQAAQAAECSIPTMHKIEDGKTGFRSPNNLAQLLIAYKVPHTQADRLLDWHKHGKTGDWWTSDSSNLPSGMPFFLALEEGATEIRVWQMNVIFGLLQTEEYAESLMRAAQGPLESTTEFVERSVAVRMERKRILEPGGPQVQIILDESALRAMVGDERVMVRQYEELLRIMDLPNVAVHVYPFSSPGYREVGGSFALFEFDKKALPRPFACIPQPSWSGVKFMTKEFPVRTFDRQFRAMSREVLPVQDSKRFIERLIIKGT
jgi:transcriptional regulator with XRE-family HTH domain